jgi:hypothetical protein
MFPLDPFMKAGLAAFFVSTLLGCLAYVLATFLAWWFFAHPRHIYLSRLVFLLGFILVVIIYNTPDFMFSGPRDRGLPIWMKLEGANYGTLTLFMWLIIALCKRPKAERPKPPKPGAEGGGGSRAWFHLRRRGSDAPPDKRSPPQAQ